MTLLRAFHAVAEAKSFTLAARALSVTQPTLSAHVKALEGSHHVRLFDRRRRGVRLTADGRALHALTQQIFELEARAEELLSATGELVRGHLRVGADAPVHVIPAVAELGRRHPALTVAVSIGNSQQLLSGLLHHDTDVAVLADVPPSPRLYVQAIQRDRVVLVVGRDHPWARRRSVRLRELAGERLVIREQGSTTRAILERQLRQKRITPRALLEIGSREAVREAVAAGLGVGPVFEAEVGHDARLRKVRVSDAPLHGNESVVCLIERRDHAAVRAFIAGNRSSPIRPIP